MKIRDLKETSPIGALTPSGRIDSTKILTMIKDHIDWRAQEDRYIEYFVSENQEFATSEEDARNSPEFKEFVEWEVVAQAQGAYENIIDKMQVYNEQAIKGWRMLTIVNPRVWVANLRTNRPIPLGSYWAWEEGAAEAHWGQFGKGQKEVLVRAIIPASGIDWSWTLIKNVNMEEEKEIYITPGTLVQLDSIGVMNGGYPKVPKYYSLRRITRPVPV